MSATDSISDDLLRTGYQRWLRLEEEKAAIGDDLKELFAEYKGHGFVPKALRESFRRVRNIDDADQQEHDAIVDLYVTSLTRGTRAYTRESGIPSHGATVRRAPAPTRPAESRGDEISAPIVQFPDPHTSKVDGGRPHQSSDAGGAKIDSFHAVDGRAAVEAGHSSIKSEQQPEDQSQDRNEPVSEAASSATPFEPPTFLIKASGTMQDTRPHCLNPDACGAWRPGHCYTCSKAAGLNEDAA